MSLKQLRLADKSVALQHQVITELNSIVKDIERCERTITDLQSELAVSIPGFPALEIRVRTSNT